VHVVDVSLEIEIVANRMFSKAPLPKRVFAVAMTLDRHAGGNGPMREMSLDPPPAAGEIGIAWQQRPDRMQVVRQDDDGFDREGRSCRATRNAARKAST